MYCHAVTWNDTRLSKSSEWTSERVLTKVLMILHYTNTKSDIKTLQSMTILHGKLFTSHFVSAYLRMKFNVGNRICPIYLTSVYTIQNMRVKQSECTCIPRDVSRTRWKCCTWWWCPHPGLAFNPFPKHFFLMQNLCEAGTQKHSH